MNATPSRTPVSTGKRTQLAFKLSLRIFMVLVVVFVAMVSLIMNNIQKDLISREMDKLERLANENATIASEFMENILYREEVIVSAVSNIKDMAATERVPFLADLLNATKGNLGDALSLFYVAEPDTLLDGTPNGYSIFVTEQGISIADNRFTYVNEKIYTTARDGKNMVIGDPFKKAIDGKEYTVLTLLLPVFDDGGNVVGMVGGNIDTALLGGAAYDTGGFSSFTNEIFCGHKTMIINSADTTSVGQTFAQASNSADTDWILNHDASTSFSYLDTLKTGEKVYRSYVPFYVGSSQTPWFSGTSITQDEFNQTILQQLYFLVAISVVGLGVMASFCYVNIRRMLRPLAELENAARQTASGNLGTVVKHHSNDELGSLAESFNASAKTLSFYINDIDHIMDEMSQGNFNTGPSQPYVGDFANIAKSIEQFTTRISETLNGIGNATNYVADGSTQVSNTSMILSQGATEQASSIEELSATIADISNQVQQNARQAVEASHTAGEAGVLLEQSNSQMREMIAAMGQISASSDEIGKIIKTIEDIAFQTNILALNAAVEAARAGTAGKGFAVVADEVRNLASKSAEASKNTSALIESSIQAVGRGTRIADETAQSLAAVVVKAQAVVEGMNNISSACAEQALAINQVTEGADQISQVISTNSATSEETAAAAQELSGQSQQLKALIGSFNIKEGVAVADPQYSTPQRSGSQRRGASPQHSSTPARTSFVETPSKY